MDIIGKYKNGNYNVVLMEDGTKIRYNDLDSLIPDRPESMDVKITNYCTMMCPMCHENSTPNGKHADIMSSSFIDNLQPYTELDLGGGSPLDHPDLVPFLEKCKNLKLIPSITVHQDSFMKNIGMLKNLSDNKLIYGLGVSFDYMSYKFIDAIKQFPNAVIHIINGIAGVSELKTLAHKDLKILILGYKEFRRGKDLYTKSGRYIDSIKANLYDTLPTIIEENWFSVVSFDNLAIKQLEPQRCMSDEQWQQFFMGNDSEYTYYVDMVKKEFAGSSTSTKRYKLINDPIKMFDVVRNEVV